MVSHGRFTVRSATTACTLPGICNACLRRVRVDGKVLPAIKAITVQHRQHTVFTRFIPAEGAG